MVSDVMEAIYRAVLIAQRPDSCNILGLLDAHAPLELACNSPDLRAYLLGNPYLVWNMLASRFLMLRLYIEMTLLYAPYRRNIEIRRFLPIFV